MKVVGRLIKGAGKGVRKLGDYVHSFSPGAYAHKRSMEGWREQTEYNTPKNQVKRLREAGLAPQLMYGQGTTAATGQADPAPEQSGTGPGLIEVLGKFVDGIKAVSETKRAAAQTKGQLIENQYQEWYNNAEHWITNENFTGTIDSFRKALTKFSFQQALVTMKKDQTNIKQIMSAIKKMDEDARWQKFENDFREKYKINMSEGWKVKLGILLLNALGKEVTEEELLKQIK